MSCLLILAKHLKFEFYWSQYTVLFCVNEENWQVVVHFGFKIHVFILIVEGVNIAQLRELVQYTTKFSVVCCLLLLSWETSPFPLYVGIKQHFVFKFQFIYWMPIFLDYSNSYTLINVSFDITLYLLGQFNLKGLFFSSYSSLF